MKRQTKRQQIKQSIISEGLKAYISKTLCVFLTYDFESAFYATNTMIAAIYKSRALTALFEPDGPLIYTGGLEIAENNYS